MNAAACAFAAWWTGWNRKPLTIVLFVPAWALFIAAGWMLGHADRALLIVTTWLSIDASLSARMVMLTQARQTGEEPAAT